MLSKIIKLRPQVVIWQFNFTDPADDKYFKSGLFYPIPHPQNMFRKSPFPFDSVILSFLDGFSMIYIRPIREIRGKNYMKEASEGIPYSKIYIKKAYQICKENGIKFFLVFMPENDLVSTLLKKSICIEIPCVYLGLKKEHFFLTDGHLNSRGNNYVAEKIYESIRVYVEN